MNLPAIHLYGSEACAVRTKAAVVLALQAAQSGRQVLLVENSSCHLQLMLPAPLISTRSCELFVASGVPERRLIIALAPLGGTADDAQLDEASQDRDLLVCSHGAVPNAKTLHDQQYKVLVGGNDGLLLTQMTAIADKIGKTSAIISAVGEYRIKLYDQILARAQRKFPLLADAVSMQLLSYIAFSPPSNNSQQLWQAAEQVLASINCPLPAQRSTAKPATELDDLIPTTSTQHTDLPDANLPAGNIAADSIATNDDSQWINHAAQQAHTQQALRLQAEATLQDQEPPDKPQEPDAVASEVLDGKAAASEALDDKAEAGKTLDDEAVTSKTLDDKTVTSKTLDDEAEASKTLDDEAMASKTLDDKAEAGKALDDEAMASKTLDDKAEAGKALDDEAMASKTLDDKAEAGKALDDEAMASKTLDDKAEAGKALDDEAMASKTLDDKAEAGKAPDDEAMASKTLDDKATASSKKKTGKATRRKKKRAEIKQTQPASVRTPDEKSHPILMLINLEEICKYLDLKSAEVFLELGDKKKFNFPLPTYSNDELILKFRTLCAWYAKLPHSSRRNGGANYAAVSVWLLTKRAKQENNLNFINISSLFITETFTSLPPDNTALIELWFVCAVQTVAGQLGEGEHKAVTDTLTPLINVLYRHKANFKDQKRFYLLLASLSYLSSRAEEILGDSNSASVQALLDLYQNACRELPSEFAAAITKDQNKAQNNRTAELSGKVAAAKEAFGQMATTDETPPAKK